MSKLFNAQNAGGSGPPQFKSKEYLIYFTDEMGAFDIYRYNRNTGQYQLASKASELINANNIYVSYAYLGGINLCNYSYTKSENGAQVDFTFNLRVLSSLSGAGTFWDIPKSAFIEKRSGSYVSLQPIKTFTITVLKTSPERVFQTQFTTFGDLVLPRAYTTDLGPYTPPEETTTPLLSIRDHQSGYIYSRDYAAMVLLEDDMKQSNVPRYLSFRAGYYYDNQGVISFSADRNLIAAFYGFVKRDNQWYKRLCMVSQANHSFNITTQDTVAVSAIVEAINGNIDYGSGSFGSRSFGYYSLDNME